MKRGLRIDDLRLQVSLALVILAGPERASRILIAGSAIRKLAMVGPLDARVWRCVCFVYENSRCRRRDFESSRDRWDPFGSRLSTVRLGGRRAFGGRGPATSGEGTGWGISPGVRP